MEDHKQFNPTPGAIPARKTTPREVALRYLPLLPLVIASVILFLVGAYIKLRYSPNIYSVTGTILIKDPNPYASKTEKFDDVLFGQSSRNLNDEIQMLRSSSIAQRVVRKLGMEVRYFTEGKIRTSEIHQDEVPFRLNIYALKDSSKPFTIAVHINGENQFSLGKNKATIFFNQPFETAQGKFSLDRTEQGFSGFSSKEFAASYAPTQNRADELMRGLKVSQSGESTNILQLTYATENPQIGVSVVNAWMEVYKRVGMEDKKAIADSALDFIEDQMKTVTSQLGDVEGKLQGYREQSRIYAPEQQSQQYFSRLSNLETELTRQGVQIQIIDNLSAYIADRSNPWRKVASTLGIEEPSLGMQITDFNKLQVQRETLLKTTTAQNQMVVDLETAIEKLRVDILQNLKNIRSAYELSASSLRARNNEAGQQVAKIPGQENQLLNITRQQKILQELFSYLLQKKFETSIGKASTISNVRVVEPARSSPQPVLPNRRGTYTLAFFLGLLTPAFFIFLRDYLNDRVDSRDEIQRGTNTPIIGEIGHSEEPHTLVVSSKSRKFIAEQFRIIRSNLQYFLPKNERPVIMVTSSYSGEGKSFISTNVGAVMALTGKKTVIMEFDIRKPKILTGLDLKRNKSGITNFIIGAADFDDLPIAVQGTENLFVIPCGPVPPNPAELLLDPRMDLLMAKVRENFDVVVIDTAPVGLVSDSVTLGKYADCTLFVVRNEYTLRKQLQMIEEIYQEKKLPHLSLVINDIRVTRSYGNYYGYGGYSYSSYGYGYGSDYFDRETTKKKSWYKKLRERIGI